MRSYLRPVFMPLKRTPCRGGCGESKAQGGELRDASPVFAARAPGQRDPGCRAGGGGRASGEAARRQAAPGRAVSFVFRMGFLIRLSVRHLVVTLRGRSTASRMQV